MSASVQSHLDLHDPADPFSAAVSLYQDHLERGRYTDSYVGFHAELSRLGA